MNEWTPGTKHPDTPKTVFMNVWEWDRMRKFLTARCELCDHVVSRDEVAVKELILQCDNRFCHCKRPAGSKTHQVCDLCYYMYRALYTNTLMRNMNYFKEIDEREKKLKEDRNRRMGMDDGNHA